MKFFLFLSLIYFQLSASITIIDAWQSVKDNNDGVKASKEEISKAELKKSSAESMYLPSISVTGSYTHLSEPVNINTSDASIFMASLPIPLPFPSQLNLSEQDVFLADLHLLWPIYTGGKIDAAQDIYSAQVTQAKALSQMKKDIEFLKLIKYYYGVVVSNSLYKTKLEAQKALQLHYENAKKLKNAGQIAKVELLNAEVKFDSAKIDSTKVKHKLEIVTASLYSLIKQNSLPSSKIFVNENMQTQEYYKTQTTQNYAGLAVLDAKEKQSNSLIAIKEAAWHPSVSGFANYNLYKDDSAIMNSLPTWFAGVIVKINLLQRKDRAQEIQAAKLMNSKVKHLKEEAIVNLALLVEKTYKEMIAYKEEFNSLNSSLALAKENYKLRNIAFSEGLSTSVEVVDAQIFLMGAKTARLNAAYNFVKKVSQLCVLSGDREKFFEILSASQEIK